MRFACGWRRGKTSSKQQREGLPVAGAVTLAEADAGWEFSMTTLMLQYLFQTLIATATSTLFVSHCELMQSVKKEDPEGLRSVRQ